MTLPGAVQRLIACLEQAGYPAYAVGGCVRDSLMGRTPHDWDLCTAATPEQVKNSLGARYALIPTGIAHGTVTVLIDHVPYEVTTFRTDGPYTDHRRPECVAFVADLREDLARRDFTINAMAYHPEKGLIDPFEGQADIAAQIVRCVGNPAQRFDEDALRILRALRLAAACGFSIDADTAAAMRAQCEMLVYIARERVRTELEKLLCAPQPAVIMADFADVLCAAVPLLRPLAEDEPRWTRALSRVPLLPPEGALRWAALLWEMPPTQADALLCALRCDNATRARVASLLNAGEMPIPSERTGLLRALRALGEAGVWDLLRLRAAAAEPTGDVEAALHALLRTAPCYTLRDLALKGHDLMSLGVPPGAALGRALELLLDAVIEGRVENARQALTEYGFRERVWHTEKIGQG